MASEFSEVKPIHFFKIILTQNLHEGKLVIPRKFVEKYGEGLPEAICLKTPNGGNWELNLLKNDGKIWFQKGWKEFADFHSLAHGHLLVFRYERTSHFKVKIFDKSALEINYPFKRVEAKRVSSNGQGNKPPNGENYRSSQKRKANPSSEFLQSCEFGSSSGIKSGKSQKVDVHHTHKKCKGKQVITTAKKVTSLERAKSFKTCNPSFIVVMGASYVGCNFALTIPSMFGKTHFDLNKDRGDIDFVLNGRVWSARYLIRMTPTGLRFELSSGWKAFAMDNNLKVGDVCNFDQIISTNMTFQVRIFRDTDKESQKSSQGKKKGDGNHHYYNHITTITK